MLTPMLSALTAYYREQRILSTAFTCPYQDRCKGDCASFTGPKSAFVPEGYERHDLPRVLILSSDSGSGAPKEESGLPEAVRREHGCRQYKPTYHGYHWYRTHELAWYILRRLDPDDALKIHDVNRFFAHTNAAKCSVNNPNRREAENTLFQNCRPYLRGELEILQPDILVTQGAKARDAVNELFQTSRIDMAHFSSYTQKIEESDRIWLERYASPKYILEIKNLTNRTVFWLRTVHPTAPFRGKKDFLGQIDQDESIHYYRDGEPRRCRGWLRYADIIHDWWSSTRGSLKTSQSIG